MNYIDIDSSNLKSVAYDGLTTLGIRFQRGGEYHYTNVPPAVFVGLLSASSSGSYFHKHIRNNYKCVKVVAVPEEVG